MDAEPAGPKGRLTTHVLDTYAGSPAAGVRIELFRLVEHQRTAPLLVVITNADGRCDAPLLSGASFVCGVYELVFHVGDYFRGQRIGLPVPAFIDCVPVRFGVADNDRHYHVPLLIAPFGYTTYRGS